MTGVLLRIQFHFFFPQQLSAFREHPALITAAYSFFLAGNITLWPAIVTLARLIGRTKPAWATWGASLVVFGLFARTFHAGADHLAFQIVRLQGVETATRLVAGSYGAFHVVSALNAVIVFGWVVLAIGVYRSGTLGVVRSLCLGLMAALMMGVLKGSSVMSVICTSGLCVALTPLGVAVLNAEPKPGLPAILRWFVFLSVLVAVLFYTGQLG